MVGWFGRGRVLIGDMWHAWMFQREDEIDGNLYGVDESGSPGLRPRTIF